jgi:FtsP/CotA-like multicopper oxidase with cupredoxin domain
MRAPLRLDRRAVLLGGAAATIWAWRSGASAAAPAPAPARRLTAAPAAQALAPAPAAPTRLLSYEGTVPGPLIRLKLGDELALGFANRLDAPTALSFPGLRIANALAGIAGLTQAPIAPGGEAEIRFTPLDAGFNLYLPEAGAATARQLASGLFGPIVVEEPAPPEVDLEAAVVLADWRLDETGRLRDDSGPGGTLVTAGASAAPQRFAAPPGGRVRLRLANASAARAMTIAVVGATPLIVAVDGQPSAPFAPLRNFFPVGPGARFELVFDTAEATVAFSLRDDAASDPDRPLVVFASAGAPKPARPEFAGLPANPLLPKEIDLARARRFELTLSGGDGAALAINGESLTNWSAKPQFSVRRGAPVTLALINATAATQTMRLGGHVARLLHALDDGWEPYWRDIFVVPPGKTVRLAFVADNPGKWPIASATPAARAAGLSGWFQVG